MCNVKNLINPAGDLRSNVLQGGMIRHVIALAVVLLVLSGCSGADRTLSTTVPSYASLPNGRDPRDPDQYSELGKRFSAKGGLIPTLEELHKRRLNILEMSGGDAKGAFGAGLLIGWGESGTRPKFDVVTGISAGALLSTWAFLGGPKTMPSLRTCSRG